MGRVRAEADIQTSGAAHRVFLSYAGIDSEAAFQLARRLEESEEAKAQGLKVWFDKRDLVPGGRWKDTLQSALGGSTAFAVYVGSREALAPRPAGRLLSFPSRGRIGKDEELFRRGVALCTTINVGEI